jgi:hypothetical protein
MHLPPQQLAGAARVAYPRTKPSAAKDPPLCGRRPPPAYPRAASSSCWAGTPCDTGGIAAVCWSTGSWKPVSRQYASKRAITHSRQKIWPQAIACGLLLDISATNSQRQTSQRLSECRTSIAAQDRGPVAQGRWFVVTEHNEEKENPETSCEARRRPAPESASRLWR